MPSNQLPRAPHCRWIVGLTSLPLLLGLVGVYSLATRPATTILVVTSAETQSNPRHDPPLSVTGLERAWALARILREAGISAVYATDSRAARQSAQPPASVLSLPIGKLPNHEPGRLSDWMVTQHRGATLLLVAEPADLPQILSSLGMQTDPASQTARDGLYWLTLPPLGPTQANLLHYARLPPTGSDDGLAFRAAPSPSRTGSD